MWLKPGLEAVAAQPLLPPTPVRMLLDKNGNNTAAQVEFETFNRQLNAVNRHTGSKLVNAVQQDVHAILQLGGSADREICPCID